MNHHRTIETDEGYVEQRFDEPYFMKHWTDDQKAEFAYQLLLCIPISKTLNVVDRLSPLLHRDFISALPFEISSQILLCLDVQSLTCMSRISKKWKLASEDQTLWKDLFYSAGWTSNKEAIHEYLANKPTKTSLASCIPRTTDARLKPFKRSTDFDLSRNTSKSSSSNQNSLAIRPTQVYPSRSQPCSSSASSYHHPQQQQQRELLAHLVTERPFLNRPPPRRHVKYDETAIFHYKETFDTRFINWKRLYRNRNTIEKRWQDGRCKVKQFPPPVKHELIVDNETQHNGGIYCLQFDHSILVTGSRDRNLKVWDIKTGRLKFTLEGHSGSVLCLQFDHRYLITGSSDSTLIVWDIHTGQKIKSLVGHGESVLNVKLLGNTVVSCSKDRTVRIWDLEKGSLEMTLRGHRAAVNAVQFKHDKSSLPRNTGKCIKTLDSHSRGIACVEYDGQYIISGSSDQSIRVWSADTGECLHTLEGHTDLVRTLQLDGKSKRIVSGSYDGSLKIWSLQDGKLLKSFDQAVYGRILNLQFDYGRIVCCSNLGKIVMYDFTHGIDTQFLL
ncbi:WD40-repeat-containing domain protein [Mucor mucedo]|uniref:WD40-repeat-containing domain protein n=1 Tax=Mucor mucedo TaxID=29922 RepID=UPI00221F1343|nr:WD40-repeat-containing domain protein [Mucor mucedo]KAI7896032.1 WD40-repeat-containing domain protein [Mucor mucedo]